MKFSSRLVLPVLFASVLAGCENSATAYKIDGKDHALMLVREQRWAWSDEIAQAVIAARLPKCQRRVAIWPGNGGGLDAGRAVPVAQIDGYGLTRLDRERTPVAGVTLRGALQPHANRIRIGDIFARRQFGCIVVLTTVNVERDEIVAASIFDKNGHRRRFVARVANVAADGTWS